VVADGSSPPLAQQVTDGFGLGTPRRMTWTAQGAMGQVWRLDTEAGSYAVKESLQRQDPTSFELQLRFAAAVSERAHEAGLVVPGPVRSTAGPLLLPIRAKHGTEPRHVRVATWITGSPGVDTSSAASWLGSTMAIIENLPDLPPPPPRDAWMQAWFTQAPSTVQWTDLAERSDNAGAPWTTALTRQLPAFAALTEIVGPAQADRLIVAHTDLQPNNVLTTTSGYTLLDWDDAASTSRDRVLARAITDWHLHRGVIDVDAVHATLTAYRAGGGTGTLHQVDAFGDLAAAFLNHLYEQIETTLDQSTDHAEDSAGHVIAMITNPVDITTLHRLRALDTPG
jgi:Ser/Thr protein kinase RdoA (MazF antagonist)